MIYEESENLELKKSTSELKEAIISIVSILNKSKKGSLYFGIKDTGEVLGQEVTNKTIRNVTKTISENIEPKIYPSVSKIIIEGKECIVVEFEGEDVPYFAYGRAYMRVGDEDRQLSQKLIKQLILKDEENTNRWEEKESNIDFEDIDEETLKKFIEKGKKKGRICFDYTNVKDILNKLNLLTKSGEIKNAAYVLFGKEPSLQLRVAIFATEEKTIFLDMQDYKGNIFKLIDIGEQYISKNIRWSANFNTGKFEREDIPEVPIRAMREILCNSFCHRIWNRPYDNNIAIYKDRIEICNPGHFTDEATPEDYINGDEPSRPRNPLIAQTIYLSGEIEKWGSGIKNVYKKCQEENLKVKFEDRKTAFFVVVYRKDLQELEENTKKDLNTNVTINVTINVTVNQSKILEIISKNPYITQDDIARELNITKRTVIRNMKD